MAYYKFWDDGRIMARRMEEFPGVFLDYRWVGPDRTTPWGFSGQCSYVVTDESPHWERFILLALGANKMIYRCEGPTLAEANGASLKGGVRVEDLRKALANP